ncbi:Uma2 family endonuclease [Phytoactinopolyspora halotolerans]|uniref:Uma2 family endonuclease n=1 Tax=Phytoactinopolyspora halotolerans TaxID=1981512 RepID=A0A6L9S7W1_9ACTN|nr:Uma2 family endonuclease [Phytoactinopolyspora halotolerans]
MSAAQLLSRDPGHGGYTVADLHALPEDGPRYELIDGSIIVSPSATIDHNLIARWIANTLEESNPGGACVVGSDQSTTVDDHNEPRLRDTETKRALYARAGARHTGSWSRRTTHRPSRWRSSSSTIGPGSTPTVRTTRRTSSPPTGPGPPPSTFLRSPPAVRSSCGSLKSRSVTTPRPSAERASRRESRRQPPRHRDVDGELRGADGELAALRADPGASFIAPPGPGHLCAPGGGVAAYDDGRLAAQGTEPDLAVADLDGLRGGVVDRQATEREADG